MTASETDKRAAWKAITIFLVILTAISAVWHFAIVALAPVSIYVGALMWCPAIAAFLTLKVTRRKIASLPWGIGTWRDNIQSYLIPVAYVTISYALAWIFGFGGVPDAGTVSEWSAELGLPCSDLPCQCVCVCC